MGGDAGPGYATCTPEQVAVVALYELAGRCRGSVVEATERALSRVS